MSQPTSSSFTTSHQVLIAFTAVAIAVAILAVTNMRLSSKPPSSGDGLADANKQFYGKMASMYDKFAGQAAFHKILGTELVARSKWIGIDLEGKDLRVLDYACGTGAVSQVLAPYSQQVLGVDLSAPMVDIYNEKAKELGYTETMKAVVGDLMSENPPAELSDKDDKSLWDFDVVVVGLGFHHFGDLQHAINCLIERLKPNGVLLIIDFGPHEDLKMPIMSEAPLESGDAHQGPQHFFHHDHSHGHGHGDSHGHGPGSRSHGVAHSGFGKPQIDALFTAAGLVDVAADDLATGFVWGPPPIEAVPEEDRAQFERMVGMMSIERDIFIARGTKPKL